MKMSELIESTNIPAKLVRAVVRQMGGWESFCSSAEDITNHGILAGFCGFIYYSDTLPFFGKNRKEIIEMAEQQAEDFGAGLLEMVANFNCLNKAYTLDEVGRTLYGTSRQWDTAVANAMALYAGEEVARAYCDVLENAK